MNDDTLNKIVNNYVRDNLSPKPEQREYISEKYGELKKFLGGACFRTGSYARYTAIDPVHDLDVIYPVTDTSVRDNPATLLSNLEATLKKHYQTSITKVARIYRQSHSVTVELADSPEGIFSIDVVPGVELSEKNGYGQSLYSVPEILRLNRHNRQRRYEQADSQPIGWIKSDPRGYKEAARILNEANANFRHAAKLLKGWRHACKMAYEDEFKFKSFHLEQIVRLYFEENPESSTIEAVVNCLNALPDYLIEAQIPDRADETRCIDEYVEELTDKERSLILNLQADAVAIAIQLANCNDEAAVVEKLQAMTTVNKQPKPVTSGTPRTVSPRQPWAY